MSRARRRAGAGAGVLAAVALSAAGAADNEPLGRQHYLEHCAPCHGSSARGDGPLAAALVRAPTDLTRLAADNGGAFPETLVYQVIDGRRIVRSHGTRAMPVWGRRFRLEGADETQVELRITTLIDYLDSLQEPASQ
ncbi:MAG: cytochrome c [Gammaproteobacteria bacterium]